MHEELLRVSGSIARVKLTLELKGRELGTRALRPLYITMQNTNCRIPYLHLTPFPQFVLSSRKLVSAFCLRVHFLVGTTTEGLQHEERSRSGRSRILKVVQRDIASQKHQPKTNAIIPTTVTLDARLGTNWWKLSKDSEKFCPGSFWKFLFKSAPVSSFVLSGFVKCK